MFGGLKARRGVADPEAGNNARAALQRAREQASYLLDVERVSPKRKNSSPKKTYMTQIKQNSLPCIVPRSVTAMEK